MKTAEKAKNPRSQQEIGCREIENILKTAGFILFFLKKLPPPLPNSRNRQKSGHQGGQTAPKWLDNTVKPCPKIGWRNRHFSTIQQRNKPVTSFLSQAYGRSDGILPRPRKQPTGLICAPLRRGRAVRTLGTPRQKSRLYRDTVQTAFWSE